MRDVPTRPKGRKLRQAVERVPSAHAHVANIVDDILDKATRARQLLHNNCRAAVPYYRTYIRERLWRLDVDGLTSDGFLIWDGAKFDTRVPGRLSSEAARKTRDEPQFQDRSPGALQGHVCPDHLVPRNCVARVLVDPEYEQELGDPVAVRSFLASHAEIAIIAPGENRDLDEAGFKATMPEEWWNAPFQKKVDVRMSRYRKIGLVVKPWPEGFDTTPDCQHVVR